MILISQQASLGFFIWCGSRASKSRKRASFNVSMFFKPGAFKSCVLLHWPKPVTGATQSQGVEKWTQFLDWLSCEVKEAGIQR